MNRSDYLAKHVGYLRMAEEGDLTKIHSTALARRQLYANLATLYFQLWRDAPVDNY
jgi:hypothetical protein